MRGGNRDRQLVCDHCGEAFIGRAGQRFCRPSHGTYYRNARIPKDRCECGRTKLTTSKICAECYRVEKHKHFSRTRDWVAT